MAQNIYDNPEFFAGYSQLARQVQGLAGAPEWPTTRAMLPDLNGKRVLDLGCGFGWFARWAREHGATSVLGLDLSENMIGRAKAMTSDPAIEYRIADLDVLELPQAAFDFAYGSLAFHYVADFGRLMRTVYRSLTPVARLVFTIEHPVFMAAARPRWGKDEDGRDTWPVNRYAIEGERSSTWFTDGVLKYHRTMATTLNTLIATGFTIREVGEFAPSADQIKANPDLAKELERPMMLHISVQR